MAWTAPNTIAAGDVLSATAHNTYLRDNLNYLHTGRPAGVIARNNGGVYSIATATGWAAIDSTNLANTLTLTTGRVLIACVGSFYADASSRLLSLDVDLDGTRIGGTDGIVKKTLDTNATAISFTIMKVGLSTGSHTFKLFWKIGAGTGYLFSGTDVQVHFTVAEW